MTEHLPTSVQAFAATTQASIAALGGRLTATGQRLASLPLARRAASRALVVGIAAMVSHPAAAQAAGGAGSLDSFLNNVVNMITGTTGQAIAIIAVALCGLGAMFGALSARAFGGVVLGCAIVFSAAWIVNKITGAGA